MSEPVQITLNATAAQLLIRLAGEMGTNNPSAVVMRALGLLDMATRVKAQGGTLVLRNAQGTDAEVAF